VDVGNSRGVLAGYDVTLVGIGATVRTGPAHAPLALRLHHAAADVPSPSDIERLVAEVDRRLTPPLLEASVTGRSSTVALAPRAVIALLTPLRQTLLAGELARGPLSEKAGQRVFSPLLTVRDDPLMSGRPGSRPLDDEGVVTRPITLIEAGVLRGGLANLDMGSRMHRPSTGHGVRTPGAPPRVGWSNFVVGAGEANAGDLAAWAGDGLVVLDLPSPAGNLVDGWFALATPWAYRVERGEITGRLERAVLRGNLYELLNRIGAMGNALEWTGAAAAPAMLLEGVEFSCA
jgi:predicted Zn-dependent protease